MRNRRAGKLGSRSHAVWRVIRVTTADVWRVAYGVRLILSSSIRELTSKGAGSLQRMTNLCRREALVFLKQLLQTSENHRLFDSVKRRNGTIVDGICGYDLQKEAPKSFGRCCPMPLLKLYPFQTSTSASLPHRHQHQPQQSPNSVHQANRSSQRHTQSRIPRRSR